MIDYSAFRFSKGQPRVIARHRKRVDAETRLKEAYKAVDARDAGRCWVTGVRTEPGHPDPRRGREHHHLKGRRVEPSWRENPDRIITVSRMAHQLITSGFLVVEGVDARKPIFFHWAEHVKAEHKPFRIRAKARKAEES